MTKHMMRLAAVAFGLFAAQAALAQAPAGAPAGAGGICKDGTYSMQTTKAGACRGHKGVQTWYLAETDKPAKAAKAAPATAAPKPAPSPINSPQAAPAPTPMQAPQPRPTPASPAGPMNAPATPAPKNSGPRGSMASKPVAPGGGPGLVWVNTETKVYHCMGDEFYGKTKQGAYMSEADAKAKGARGDHGRSCAGK